MNGQVFFLYTAAGLSLAFAAVDTIRCLWKRGKTVVATGTVIFLWSPNPDTAKKNNSNWATVSYKASGREFTSRNRVQVPMGTKVGHTVKIRYDRERPEILYSFSTLRSAVAFLIAGILLAAALWMRG